MGKERGGGRRREGVRKERRGGGRRREGVGKERRGGGERRGEERADILAPSL